SREARRSWARTPCASTTARSSSGAATTDAPASAPELRDEEASGRRVEREVEAHVGRRRGLVDAQRRLLHGVDGEDIAVVAVAGRRRRPEIARLAGVIAGLLRALGQTFSRPAAGAAWQLGDVRGDVEHHPV